MSELPDYRILAITYIVLERRTILKTWFITGVGRGLGSALVDAILTRGDRVIGTVREGSDAPTHDRLRLVTLDLVDPAAIKEAIGTVLADGEQIDVLVNNAGYGLLGATEAASDDEIARLFEVNVFAPVRLIRGLLPHMRANGWGRIVNITSIAGRAPMASSALYAAAKSAMEGLSHALAQEVAPLGLRVIAVAPGSFRTDFLTGHSIRRSDDALADVYAASVGRALEHLDAIAGQQAGDPARAAAAIIDAVLSDDPPAHLLLGRDALRRTHDRLAADAAEIARWEHLTVSTDFEAEAGA